MKSPDEKSTFNETLVIADEQSWIWNWVSQTLDSYEHLRLPSTVPIRQSWVRFKDAERIIIYWENPARNGGPIVEEILDVAPLYDVASKIIVLTTDPTHEDVVYFSELGIQKILRLRNRDKDLETAGEELKQLVAAAGSKSKTEEVWHKITRALTYLPVNPPEERKTKLLRAIEQAKDHLDKKPTARYFDALAQIAAKDGQAQQAIDLWQRALEVNPNFFRSYNHLIAHLQSLGRHQEAMSLMQKMQALNKNNVARLVSIGEAHVALHDDGKAEHYFKAAIEKDKYSSGALNGLAEIRFRQGNLEESRELLSKSPVAYKIAAALNKHGVELVQAQRYEEALDHYTKAQYVLPLQDKGPMLFFNIGLCYSRWGKTDMAAEFLKIALIKEPNYKKAQRLLDQIAAGRPGHAAA